MCAAGMAPLVVHSINVYSTAKPKAAKPLFCNKAKRCICIISVVHCGEAQEEKLGRSRYSSPDDWSPSDDKPKVKFLHIAWLLLLLLYALMKSIYFDSVSWVSYHILMPRVFRLTNSLFYYEIFLITLDINLMISWLYFLLWFRLPPLVVSHPFSLILTVFGTWNYVMQGHLFFCLVIICYLD